MIFELGQRWSNSHEYHMTIRVFSYIALYLGYVVCFLDQFLLGHRHSLKWCYNIYLYGYISRTHSRPVLYCTHCQKWHSNLLQTTTRLGITYNIDRKVFLHLYIPIAARKYKKLEALRQCSRHLYRYQMFITTTVCQSHCFYNKCYSDILLKSYFSKK